MLIEGKPLNEIFFSSFFVFSNKKEDMSVQLEALDILGDLLSRFGGEFAGLVQCNLCYIEIQICRENAVIWIV